MKAMRSANFGQRPQVPQCAAIAAMSASVAAGMGNVCVAAIISSRPFTAFRHSFGFHGVACVSGASERHKAYVPICILMNGTIRSNQMAYSSRLASSLASYSAPRRRIAAALARCAARNASVVRTRRSKRFGLVVARSSNSAAWPHNAGAGGATDSVLNGTTDTARTLLGPPARVQITDDNRGGNKPTFSEWRNRNVRLQTLAPAVVDRFPDVREAFEIARDVRPARGGGPTGGFAPRPILSGRSPHHGAAR